MDSRYELNMDGLGLPKNVRQPQVIGGFLILVLLTLFLLVSQGSFLFMNYSVQTNHEIPPYLQVQTNLLNLDPYLTWNQTYFRSTFDRGYSIVECREGGFAIVGETRQGGVEFRSDVWLLRVDESGNLLWNTTFGSVDDEQGYDLVERHNGGFAFVGVQDGDLYFVETDSEGGHIQNRTLYAGDVSIGYSIVDCQTSGYAILGMISFNQTWLVRMDDNLVLWNQTFDVALFEGSNTLVECQDAGFAFTGTSNYYTIPDVVLVRTNQFGTVLWNQTYGGSGDYFSQGLVECGDGGFAFAGAKREYGEVEFNIWLVRTDSSGGMMWNTSYGADDEFGIANALVQTSDGRFALTGFEDSYAGYYDVVYIVTDPSGGLLIDSRLGGYVAEVGHSIVECQDGGFAIVGELFNFAYVYRVLLIRIFEPQNPIPPRNLWLELALLVPIAVSVVIVGLTIWLLRSKKRAAEKLE